MKWLIQCTSCAPLDTSQGSPPGWRIWPTESVLRVVVFFLFFSFHQIGTGILSRSFWSLRPSGYWPSLDNPEADWHARYPYGCGSAGWATVARVERGPFPCVLFSRTHLGQRVSAQLAACMCPLAQKITEQCGDKGLTVCFFSFPREPKSCHRWERQAAPSPAAFPSECDLGPTWDVIMEFWAQGYISIKMWSLRCDLQVIDQFLSSLGS